MMILRFVLLHLHIILLFLLSILSFKRCIAVTDYINFEKPSKKTAFKNTFIIKASSKGITHWITNHPYSRLVEPPDAFWEKSNINCLTGVEVDYILYTKIFFSNEKNDRVSNVGTKGRIFLLLDFLISKWQYQTLIFFNIKNIEMV